MEPLDRSYTTYYRPVSRIFDVEYYRNLEGHSRSLKIVPFESSGAAYDSLSTVTMAVSVAVCEIFSVKEQCDLENRVMVRSRSFEMAFDRSHTTSYSPFIVTVALSCIVCEIWRLIGR